MSSQFQQIEFHLHNFTNPLCDMWPLLNWACFLVITCLNALLTPHIKIGFGCQASALKNPFKNSIVSLKFEIISIISPTLTPKHTHASFNDIVALNSASQFIKDDLFLHAVLLFSTVLQPRFFLGKGVSF